MDTDSDKILAILLIQITKSYQLPTDDPGSILTPTVQTDLLYMTRLCQKEGARRLKQES